MEASRIGIGEALSQENLAKFGQFDTFTRNHKQNPGRVQLGHACLRHHLDGDTHSNLALSQLHKMKDHDSRKTLLVFVTEAAAVLICVCHKAGTAYVTADNLDC